MSNEKLKRYQVTQSIRFATKGTKVLFFAGMCLAAVSVLAIAIALIFGNKNILGVAVIGALLSVIWMFATRFMSESTFGFANVSFYDGGIIFRSSNATDAEHYTLRWCDCVACGLEKTRWSWWVYASDHELSDAERVEFPENVKDGVFYFNYAQNTWEEFMKFVPEQFREKLEAEKLENKIKK